MLAIQVHVLRGHPTRATPELQELASRWNIPGLYFVLIVSLDLVHVVVVHCHGGTEQAETKMTHHKLSKGFAGRPLIAQEFLSPRKREKLQRLETYMHLLKGITTHPVPLLPRVLSLTTPFSASRIFPTLFVPFVPPFIPLATLRTGSF